MGPILFLLYINDLANVSEFCFSVFFADNTNMFITGKYMSVLCRQLNEDLRNIKEWLQCNKSSSNVLKLIIWNTHARNFRNVLAFCVKPEKSHQLTLFFYIPLFHILQPCMGKKLHLPLRKNLSNTKETYPIL